MANALNKDNVTIWIAPRNTVGADLDTDGMSIKGFVTSFSTDGFSKAFEQIDVAGGNVSSSQAREQLEGELEVVLTDGVDRDIFHKIKMGEYDLGVVALQKDINGVDYLWEAVNNVVSPTFAGDFAMDGQWEGTLSFSSTAFDEEGNHNWDYGTDEITDISTGLVVGNTRTLADGTTRDNSWKVIST